MHLRIISAESDNITVCKLKFLYMSGGFRKEKHFFYIKLLFCGKNEKLS